MAFFSVALFFSYSAFCAEMSVHNRDGFERIIVKNARLAEIVDVQNGLELTKISLKNADKAIENSHAIKAIKSSGTKIVFELSDSVQNKRYFKIGDRLIIDIFYDVKTYPVSVQKPTSSPQKKVETENQIQEDSLSEDVFDLGLQTFLDDALSMEQDAPGETLPVLSESAEKDPPEFEGVETINPLAEPTILTLSSTHSFGISVFKRYGRLMIVTDQKNTGLPPQMTGGGKKLNWSVSEIPMQKGSAWFVNIPDAAFIRAEGGGFVWRVIISDQDPQLPSSSPFKREKGDENNPRIHLPMQGARNVLRFTDPHYGDDLAVFTVSQAKDRVSLSYDFVDFDIIAAAVGAVIKPQSDGLRVLKEKGGIFVEKKDVLNVAQTSQDQIVHGYLTSDDDGENEQAFSFNRVFFFDDWGASIPLSALLEHRQKLDHAFVNAEEGEKLPILFDMAKFFLSQGMGQEALGYLRLSEALDANINVMPEFGIMKGAAHLLARQCDLALDLMSHEALANNVEVLLWKSSALSCLGERKESVEVYPDDADVARAYPFAIQMQLLVPIIQAMLDEDRADDAFKILQILEVEDDANMTEEHFATISYLKGRAEKLAGHPEKAAQNLSRASLADKLGPYGIRSEIFLVQDELKREAISLDDAIKRIERLRFSWRGDYLENDIYKELGHLYIENKQARQGLNILKRAIETASSIKERRATVREMSEAYKDLFLGPLFDDFDPVEAISIYDEFKELTPVGDEGNQIINRLADKLMDIGLLSRAVSVLQDKVARLEGGEEAIKTGLRVAAIQLLDRQAEAAAETLDDVDYMIADYDGDNNEALNEKIVLLKARAFSDMGEADQALFMMEGLPETEDILRLRVDTAWRDGNWIAVSDNLDKLILREPLFPDTPPTREQAQMILNQAVALSLADQYNALQRFADQYDPVMRQHAAYKTFQVITRPSRDVSLADRETLLGLTSEVDLFNNFLEATKEEL